MYKLTETELFVPEYKHEETFSTHSDAVSTMRDRYRSLACENNVGIIQSAEIYENSAIVILNDGNEIEWDIEEV